MTDQERAALQAMISEVQAKPAAPDQGGAPQPIKFGGFEFPSMQDAEQAALSALKAKDAELQALKAERAAQQQQPAPTQMETGQRPKFDQDKYMEVWLKDPLEAQRMAMRYELLGDPNYVGPDGNPINPHQILRGAVLENIQMRQTIDGIQLAQQHPELNLNDPNIQRTIEEQRGRMGLPATLQGRHTAIRELQGMGALPTHAQWRQHVESQQQAAQQASGNAIPIDRRADYKWATPAPVPGIPAGGAGPSAQPQTEAELRQMMSGMSIPEQKALLDKMRQAG